MLLMDKLVYLDLKQAEICFENTVVATTKVERTKYQRIVDFITMLDFAGRDRASLN